MFPGIATLKTELFQKQESNIKISKIKNKFVIVKRKRRKELKMKIHKMVEN